VEEIGNGGEESGSNPEVPAVLKELEVKSETLVVLQDLEVKSEVQVVPQVKTESQKQEVYLVYYTSFFTYLILKSEAFQAFLCILY
jgi:hypothetical protein